MPSILPNFTLCDLNEILPEYISASMKEAITDMSRKLRDFDNPDAVLTGLETRSSSPVRILRSTDTLQSAGTSGLYPCGEGAGYAGGIISAAVDGIKCYSYFTIIRYEMQYKSANLRIYSQIV